MKRISVGHSRKLFETVGVSKEGFVAVVEIAIIKEIYLSAFLSNSIRKNIEKAILRNEVVRIEKIKNLNQGS